MLKSNALINNFLGKIQNVNIKRSVTQLVHCNVYNLKTTSFMTCNNVLRSTERYMAGHAKWQNVKHIKAEKDMLKVKMCDRYTRLVRAAVREGGADLKLNRKLADIIADANRHSIATSTLEGAMKRASSKKIKFGTMEIAGPGGCLIIVEYETDNESTTRHDIKIILKKYEAILLPSGGSRWRALYEQKGIIKVVGKTDGQPLDAEKALDSAIEASAEDVQSRKDEEDNIYLEFFCSPDDLHSVKKELENLSYNVEEAYVGYIPNITVQLSPADMEAAGNLFSELESLQDVVRIYENIQ